MNKKKEGSAAQSDETGCGTHASDAVENRGETRETLRTLLAMFAYPPAALLMVLLITAVSSLFLDLISLLTTGDTVTPVGWGKLLRVLGQVLRYL